MRIISSVHVEGFRSIANETLNEIGGHTVLVGKNSSGKSNILRALNLFFNGEPSPGLPVEFNRDLHYRPTRKQKREILVEVGFDLPDKFNFRTGLERLKDIGNSFLVRKIWELDRLRNVVVKTELLVNGAVIDGGEQLARDFLSLITFRYVQNRAVPADVLKDESQVIASAIFKKLREANQAADVLRGLSASAGRLLAKTADALVESGAPISKPNIATASSLVEMLRMSGFQATGLNGVLVRDEDWGAGHQAFFLLNLLREIDTDYSRQFGWRQACIWAVEEPESGLHHDLQTRLARQLVEWSSDVKRRLQIFTTTHSPVITMSGDRGYWVEVGENSSSAQSMLLPSLVRAAEEQGVSSYVHPVLSFPLNPVVLVEGAIDENVLNHVAGCLGRGILKFISLPRLDSGEGSGVDSQIAYVKKNASLIHRRPPESPFIVLVDWDVPDQKMQSLKSAYGKNADRYVVRPSTDRATKILGESFRGIERFYPEQLIRDAHNSGELSVAFPVDCKKQWAINKEDLDAAKGSLMKRLLSLKNVAEMGRLPALVELVHSASTSVANEQLGFLE
jgi:hypothetical protein